MKSYVEMISLIERVHYDYLRLMAKQLELMGANDLNSLQAVILLHIGHAEIAVNQVRTRGNYLGSNLSYIIKKLVENDYLVRERSTRDLRVAEIRLSEKGRSLYDRLAVLYIPGARILPDPAREPFPGTAIWTLHQIEQFWIDQASEPSYADAETSDVPSATKNVPRVLTT